MNAPLLALLAEVRDSLRRMDCGWCSLNNVEQLSDEEFDHLLGRIEETLEEVNR